jgi:hypothetical protein
MRFLPPAFEQSQGMASRQALSLMKHGALRAARTCSIKTRIQHAKAIMSTERYYITTPIFLSKWQVPHIGHAYTN